MCPDDGEQVVSLEKLTTGAIAEVGGREGREGGRKGREGRGGRGGEGRGGREGGREGGRREGGRGGREGKRGEEEDTVAVNKKFTFRIRSTIVERYAPYYLHARESKREFV